MPTEDSRPARLKAVHLKNFLSFLDVSVQLDDLVVLVGANSTGKSNFVDALRFIHEAVTIGLDAAITRRGGISAVRRSTPGGRPPDVEVSYTVALSSSEVRYSIVIEAARGGDWNLKSETCEVFSLAGGWLSSYGRNATSLSFSGFSFETNELVELMAASNALVLPLFAAVEPFAEFYRFLGGISAYAIYPEALRRPQLPLPSYPLDEHGENLTSVLKSMRDRKRQEADIIRDALAAVVPRVVNYRVGSSGGYLSIAIAYLQEGKEAWFEAARCSDGTLRLLGLLVALHQTPPRSLIAIEEPEQTVHPGASAFICDEVVEAAHRSQVLITTHSPDIMSRMPIESLRVVEMTDRGSEIGPVAADQMDAINRQLFSAADVVRIEGLRRQVPAGD